MKFYQDITLLPDPETDPYFLWSKVYQQVHLALVENKDSTGMSSIGLSWPNYQYSQARKHLGNKLRVFAQTEGELVTLDLSQWLSKLTDYVHIAPVRTVPETVETYVCFSRKVPKSNLERIGRRKAKRENISLEMAMDKLKTVTSQRLDLPFIRIKSLSRNMKFPVFIKKDETTNPQIGHFTSYGLSSHATVPWF